NRPLALAAHAARRQTCGGAKPSVMRLPKMLAGVRGSTPGTAAAAMTYPAPLGWAVFWRPSLSEPARRRERAQADAFLPRGQKATARPAIATPANTSNSDACLSHVMAGMESAMAAPRKQIRSDIR